MIRAALTNVILNMTRIFSDNLNDIVSANGPPTARELADEIGVGTSMIYKVKNGKAELSHQKARGLVRYLLWEYDDKRLARCFSTSEYELVRVDQANVTTNGCVDDEAADAQVALGHAIAEYREGDEKDMTDAIHDLEAVIERLKIERDRL